MLLQLLHYNICVCNTPDLPGIRAEQKTLDKLYPGCTGSASYNSTEYQFLVLESLYFRTASFLLPDLHSHQTGR